MLCSFGTQHELIHPPVKSSTIPLKKMPVFKALHLGIQFSLHPALFLFGTQQQLTHPPLKSSTLPLRRCLFFRVHPFLSRRIMFLRAYSFVNVLTLSCLGSLWFGTHPYYSLNPYVYLYCLWSISIAKDRRCPK